MIFLKKRDCFVIRKIPECVENAAEKIVSFIGLGPAWTIKKPILKTYFRCLDVWEEFDKELLHLLFLLVSDSGFLRVVVLLTRIRLGRTRSDAVLAGRRSDARISESARTPTTAASAASEIDVLCKKMIILFSINKTFWSHKPHSNSRR